MDSLKVKNQELQIVYLQSELNSINTLLIEQRQINEEYSKLINGRTDMKMLISTLQNEQKLIKDQLVRIHNDKQQALTKCLLLEQILEASEDEKRFIRNEAQQQINYLMEQNNLLQEQCSNQREDKYNDGVIIKIRQIVNVNEQTLRLHKEMEKLNQYLMQYNEQIQNLKEQKADLTKLNFTLSNEIIRLKSGTANGNSPPTPVSMKFNQPIKQQQNDESDNDSLPMSPMESKVKTIKQKKFYQVDGQVNGVQKFELIPKIDLKKAQQIQSYTMQQVAQKVNAHQNLPIQEEILKWINDYKIVKNQLDTERILHSQTVQKYNELLRFHQEALGINDILRQSQLSYEQKWRQVIQNTEIYKQFYINYKDLVDQQNSAVHTSKLKDQSSATSQQLLRLNIFNQVPQENSLLDAKFPQANTKRRQSLNLPTESTCNYKDRIIKLTKDVFQLFRHDNKQPNSQDEDFPNPQEIKRTCNNKIEVKQHKQRSSTGMIQFF